MQTVYGFMSFKSNLLKYTKQACNGTSDSLSDVSEIESGFVLGYGFFRGGLSFFAIFLLVLVAIGDGRSGSASFKGINLLFFASSTGPSAATET